MFRRMLRLAGALALLATVTTNIASAQIRSAAITGTVTDQSGGSIPDAEVVIINEQTNVSVATKTTSAGAYTAPYLPPGRYTVRVDRTGFAGFRVGGVELAAGQTVRVDAALNVGAVASTVEVTADSARLQTESTTVEGTTAASVIQAIPNINSNPMYYAALQPGVVGQKNFLDTTGQHSFGIGPAGRLVTSQISINGIDAQQNDIQLDGVPIVDTTDNFASVLPNSEGLQEVRVQTNNFSAEYGKGVGVIQYTTKGGTNEYHGSLLYKLRNEALNANGFGNNFYGYPRGAYKVNSWGGSAGGPILKNKLFFFLSYEGLHHIAPVNFNLTVPTEIERKGNFSKTLAPGPNNEPVPARLFDPFSVTKVGDNIYKRAEYANAIIPNPDVFGLRLFSYYPKPNRTPDDVYNHGNYFNQLPQKFRRDSVQSRIDFQWRNHSVYGSGGTNKASIGVPRPFGEDNPMFPPETSVWGQKITDDNPYAQIGDTVVLSPTLILDVRYGVSRIVSYNGADVPDKQLFDFSGIDFPAQLRNLGDMPNAAPVWCAEGAYNCLNFTWLETTHNLNHNLTGSVSKTTGQWTLKTGAEYRVSLNNGRAPWPPYPLFSVGDWWGNQNYTAQYIDATGNLLDAMMPDPTQYGFVAANVLTGAGWINARQNVVSAQALKYLGLYSQNDWHPTPKLTVNLGVRWDLQPGPTERYNRMSNFDVNGTNPFTGKGGIAIPGQRGYSRNYYETSYTDIAPRLGVAYRMNEKTVLRGGYGITYTPTNTYNRALGNNMFMSYTAANSAGVFGPNPNGVPRGKFYSPEANPIIPPIGPDLDNPILYGVTPEGHDRHRKNGRVQQWNVFVQRQFGGAWLASLGYSASHADRLMYTRVPLNGCAPQGACGATPSIFQTFDEATTQAWRQEYIASGGVHTPWTDQLANPWATAGFAPGPMSGTTVDRWRLMVPYPIFPDTYLYSTIGFSNYHSVIAQMRRNLSNGLLLDFAYTWSRATDLAQGFSGTNAGHQFSGESVTSYLMDIRPGKWESNEHLSFNDIPHRVTGTFVYELPFGKGKPLLAGNRLVGALAGGWKIGGAVNIMSGTPMEIYARGAGSYNSRPDRVPGVSPTLPENLQGWYKEPTAITVPGPNGQQYSFTTCGGCYLKWNPFAFQGRLAKTPGGAWIPDRFWWGNADVAYGDIRNPSIFIMDASLQREFRFTERWRLQFSANAYNVLNHTNFKPDNAAFNLNSYTDVSSGKPFLNPTAGSWSPWGYDPRQIQMQVRIVF